MPHSAASDLGLHHLLRTVCPSTSGYYGNFVSSVSHSQRYVTASLLTDSDCDEILYKRKLGICYIVLTLSTLGKIFSTQHLKLFFLLFPVNNLHEMSNPVFWEK